MTHFTQIDDHFMAVKGAERLGSGVTRFLGRLNQDLVISLQQ